MTVNGREFLEDSILLIDNFYSFHIIYKYGKKHVYYYTYYIILLTHAYEESR